jgi:Fe-S-cluster-containing hydrogenase component 2
MTRLDQHPTVRRFREQSVTQVLSNEAPTLDAQCLRQLCLDAGADDVGFVEINRAEIADQRHEILSLLPGTAMLISYVCRMNREPIRSPMRSVANLEFHHAGDATNEVGRRIVAALESHGVRALNPAVGFPMEMSRFPGKTWIISHKPIAQAAGLGVMGIHRNVIHTKFGNFILLGTILVAANVTVSNQPLSYNPCLECKLCVAACPVGAIETDGQFNFAACYTHNYREFLGGFSDWVETMVDSKNVQSYRDRVSDGETASWWQSLSSGPNYKAAYCVAVCPAGEDVIAPFLTDRKAYLQDVVKPLQMKAETIYVTPHSDAELHVQKRFPHKTTRRVHNGLHATSIPAFLANLHLAFQKNQAKKLHARYHFTFHGNEKAEATVVIADQTLTVERGHVGTANVHITADSTIWLKFLRGETRLFWCLLRRAIRIKGDPRLLIAFGRCFPR